MKFLRVSNFKRLAGYFLALYRLKPAVLFKLIRKSAEVIPEIEVRKGSNGTFCGFPNDFLFQRAVEFGVNEPHFAVIIDSLLKEDNTVLDVGANLGTHSILMSKKVFKGKVLSFEPQALTFSILQNNLLLNSCSNVFPYRFAITAKDYEVIAMEPFVFGGPRINNGDISLAIGKMPLGDLVLSKTIDELQLQALNFIKMDIQGAELSALRGAEITLMRFRPYIFLEIEERNLRKFGVSSKELIEYLLGLDYILYRVENEYPCDHICIPAELSKEFESVHASKLGFALFKICGKKVDLFFEDSHSQTYRSIVVS